jgi:hypothetical protein
MMNDEMESIVHMKNRILRTLNRMIDGLMGVVGYIFVFVFVIVGSSILISRKIDLVHGKRRMI